MLNMSILFIPTMSVAWVCFDLRYRVVKYGFLCYPENWQGIFKKFGKHTILDKTVETNAKIWFSGKNPLSPLINVVKESIRPPATKLNQSQH